jgi:hypothetical protein
MFENPKGNHNVEWVVIPSLLYMAFPVDKTLIPCFLEHHYQVVYYKRTIGHGRLL